MISAVDVAVSLMKNIPALNGRVFRAFPSARPSGSFAVVSVVGRQNVISCDGAEIASTVTLSIDVCADSPTDCEDILGAVTDALIEVNIQNVGAVTQYHPDLMVHSIIGQFRATFDNRGTSYII